MIDFFRSLSASFESSLPPEFPLFPAFLLVSCGFIVLLFFLGFLLFRLKDLKYQAAESLKKAEAFRVELGERKIREAQLTTLLTNERKHGAEKLRLLEDARTELKIQFENLAAQIFDEKSIRFSELNRDKLNAILAPFSKELGSLKQEINEIYRSDSRERIGLKNEIVQLRDLNLQVNREASNLTKALKNDTKMQGNWGELVLERILEHSGLKKGQEYSTQGGFRNHNNKLYKPDVIVHLPEGKDIIVDSKVSLINWEKYVNSESKQEQQQQLAQMMAAIRDHIKNLSDKNYPELIGIHSLDFVLMFMPIEAAFSTACKNDESIITEALAKNIIIVTPTTLLATLKTVQNIWKFEHQSKNSAEIARRAGIMYDKFRGFIEDMEKIGKQLATCHGSYDGALLKLTQGRGNLISQAEQLKELGVQVKKELPKSITDISELELKN